jgi:hypothetical protein
LCAGRGDSTYRSAAEERVVLLERNWHKRSPSKTNGRTRNKKEEASSLEIDSSTSMGKEKIPANV